MAMGQAVDRFGLTVLAAGVEVTGTTATNRAVDRFGLMATDQAVDHSGIMAMDQAVGVTGTTDKSHLLLKWMEKTKFIFTALVGSNKNLIP